MLNIRFLIVCGFLIGAAFFTAGLVIAAQSTNFNIPSTDVVTEKTAYLEGDFLAHFDSTNRGGTQFSHSKRH